MSITQHTRHVPAATLRASLFAGVLMLTLGASAAVAAPMSEPPVRPGDVFTYAETNSAIPGVTNTFTVSASGNATFNGRCHLIDLHYTYLGVPVDLFVGLIRRGSVFAQVAYGGVSIPSSGQARNVIAYPGGMIEAEYPEAPGLSWSTAVDTEYSFATNVPANEYARKLTRLQYADGSYWSHVVVHLQSITATFIARLWSNGSGFEKTSQTGYDDYERLVGLPVAGRTGYVIPITTLGGGPVNSTPVPRERTEIADWYPSGYLPPKPLAASQITITGLVKTPAACQIRAGMTAYDLHGTSSALDPIQGSYDTTVTDEYDAPGLGNVCTIEVDNGGADMIVTVLTAESGPKPLAAIGGAPSAFALDVLSPAAFLRSVTSYEQKASALSGAAGLGQTP